MPPDPRVCVGACALVVRKFGVHPRLLMVLRGAGDGKGTWSLPGGWIEYGETAFGCAERETKEETGVTVDATWPAGWTMHHPVDRAIECVTLVVRCDYAGGYLRANERVKCPEVEWVDVDDVAGRRLFEPLRRWLGAGGELLG